jgi:hypothetical protein
VFTASYSFVVMPSNSKITCAGMSVPPHLFDL